MNPNRLEPVLLLLATMIVLFTALLFVCAYFLKSDGQTFQVISGVLTALVGAFLLRIKPPKTTEDHTESTLADSK